ncbi:hypothetical protein QVD17_20945 [Tagetes erecta]|uniref:tRNA(adenine(34)) deaminase n=1 Tax=Tagetes erecta TaxID=13708 RepID=A0AAD8KQV7_TARER|nr:hypothetical protein QVD17_20945 [Tagetes erecta]
MMHPICLNSSLSLTSRSSYFNHPIYFSDTKLLTDHLLISSSFNCSSSCCCCCCCAGNSSLVYCNLPRINPSFLCNGLKQSMLIQFSPSKRLIVHGKRRQIKQLCNASSSSRSRSRFCSSSDCDCDCGSGLDRSSGCCKKVCSFKEKRRLGGGRYACRSYEDKRNEQFFSNENDDDDYVNEVELVLDLLSEEVGVVDTGVRGRKRIQKKDASNVSSRTKAVDSRYVKRDLKRDAKAVEIRSSEKDNTKLSNERITSVKDVNRERKKQGSSSSYYSVSSTGEYENESEHGDYFVKGESSGEYKDDREMDSYNRVYDEELAEKVERKQEFGKKQSEILKKNTTESYYGDQEWRKKSEKKLDVESSQSQHIERNSQRHSEKTERITYQSQSGSKNENSSTQKLYSDTENKLVTSVQELTSHRKGEIADITHQNEYKEQSSVIEASEIRNSDNRNSDKRISSSSSFESRMKKREESSTEVSARVEDKREEKHQRVDQITSIKDSTVKLQQISEISDTRLTNIENTSVSRTQSDIRTEKQELQLGSSSSSEKRKNTEDKYSSSHVEMVTGSTESMKTSRKTTKASSFNVGMQKEASSSYKALKLNPESSFQETGTHIASADEQQKSAGQLVGEFVEKAKHQLSVSEGELTREDDEQHELKSSGENGSGNYDEKDEIKGPSDEMWHESGAPSDEAAKRSGRSLWNVIGDVVRLRWGSTRSETHTPKSGGVSNQSTSSERWFSGHEPDESSRKDVSTPSSSKEKQDSPLLLSSSNTNQGSSSKPMSPLVIEGSSVPLPAIRMRRSPVVKTTSVTGETDASTSGKMDQIVPKPLTQVPHMDASGSGQMVKVEQPIPSRRKLGRVDQVSKDRFDEWEEAYTIEAKQRKNDEFFMREALSEARKAADLWEVPVGAILVQDGKIIARGYNLVEELRDSTAHAEMVCIREASNKLHSWRLSGSTLYVTLEPCPMCAGAILQARIDTVVWGAPNKLLGADGSWIRLFPDGDGGGNGSDKPPAPVHPFHPNMTVRRGVLSSECADVMQQFFQLRRKKKDKKPEAESPSPPPPSCLPIGHHHNSKFTSKLHDVFNIMFCL